MIKQIWLGILWGLLLYIVTMIVFPLIDGEKLSYYKLLIGIPVWVVVGISIEYLFNKKNKKDRK
ncbi:hypothetical protein DVK85_00355 [Flavobacterium arcticum]|uniref:Uncharacterized protein n=1 Tax=Flavobacterium arcticum TaxID=1784713 RepID=A0A345H855_9FLAO|nr:hypothetical protein [Flavobacterium arcticum]AXG72765.1 hypothetical protein DVK85_00355 [Flavobacterium arcticum]KAF2510964.1 hypothetical protein E0W72_06110 [Flavobacterium arcticum]